MKIIDISGLSATDCRYIYESLSLHENGTQETIKLDVVSLAENAFPQYLKNGTIYNYKLKQFEDKIKKILTVFQFMTLTTDLNGIKFIPYDLVKTEKDNNRESNTYNKLCFYISIVRPFSAEKDKESLILCSIRLLNFLSSLYQNNFNGIDLNDPKNEEYIENINRCIEIIGYKIKPYRDDDRIIECLDNLYQSINNYNDLKL